MKQNVATRTRLCAFCEKPQGEIALVRDEGELATTGRTMYEYACLACREKYGLKTRKQLEKEQWRKQ